MNFSIRRHRVAPMALSCLMLMGSALAQAPAADEAARDTTRLDPGFAVDTALLQAARKEGKVVFWCAWREPECQAAKDKFQQLTGVQLEFTRLSTGPQVTRLNQERMARIYSVDVVHHGDPGVWESVYKAKQWLTPYTPEGATHYAKEYRDNDGLYFAQFLVASPIGYNSKLVAPADVPRSYADLADAKYRGKVAMPHPKQSGGFNEAVIGLTGVLGADYFKRLKNNDTLVLGGSQFALNAIVANGERAIALAPVESGFIADREAGKPLEVVYPAEGTILSQIFSGIVADAPHPNAARLLQEWLHSVTLQNILTQTGNLVPHPDAVYPAGRKKLAEIKTIIVPAADIVKGSAQSKRMFSDLFGG